MSYPVSSDVSAGQPTAAAHYNNLRADALRLGQSAADGVNLGSLLGRFENNLTLEYLATNKVRVPASAASPVAVVIGGVPLLTTVSVDLPAASAPSGAAAWWYVFAVQSAGSTAFTLAANTTSTEASGTRRIGRFYWDGSAITQLKTEYRVYLEALMGLGAGPLCQGRLTLTSGAPAPTADISGATVLYFTPFGGNRVTLWRTGFGWKMYTFSELSISLVGTTASKNYDVFLYDAGDGTLTLELVVWSSDTARATALTLLDGVYVKSGDATRLYLGTVRVNSSGGQSDDMILKRFVWNYFQRLNRDLYVFNNTAHTYAGSGTWRKWNNADTNNLVEWVVGVQENVHLVGVSGRIYTTSGGYGYIKLYIDGTAYRSVTFEASVASTVNVTAGSAQPYPATIGYHYAQVYEMSNSSTLSFGEMAISISGLI